MRLYEEKIKIIKKLMSDSSSIIRCKAIQKLAKFEKISAEEILLEGLKKSKEDVDKACYIKGLCAISSFVASSYVIDLYNDKTVRV